MTNTATGPIEVWLTQTNIAIDCRVVHEDERTDDLNIDSLSMRGAQREITGHLITQGYKPDGRWTTEVGGQADSSGESWRRFKVDPDARASLQ